jgi:hypothetical protein
MIRMRRPPPERSIGSMCGILPERNTDRHRINFPGSSGPVLASGDSDGRLGNYGDPAAATLVFGDAGSRGQRVTIERGWIETEEPGTTSARALQDHIHAKRRAAR